MDASGLMWSIGDLREGGWKKKIENMKTHGAGESKYISLKYSNPYRDGIHFG